MARAYGRRPSELLGLAHLGALGGLLVDTAAHEAARVQAGQLKGAMGVLDVQGF